jgi:hypothetical protein
LIIITDPDFRGKIFRQGVFVQQLDQFYYGYNVLSDQNAIVDRDRAIVNIADLSLLVIKGWNEILCASPEKWKLYEDMMTKNSGQWYECWCACYLAPEAIKAIQKANESTILVSDSSDVDSIAEQLKIALALQSTTLLLVEI